MSLRTAPAPRGPAADVRALPGRRAVGDAIVLVVVAILIALALFGPFLAPHDPYRSEPSQRLLPASLDHLLGTDAEGRDILSRLIVGAQPTLFSSLAIVAVTTALGVVIAAVAAMGPRWLDEAIMRVCDIMLAVPALLLALAISAAIGSGTFSAALALVIAFVPADVRLVRSVMQRTMTMPFVDSATVLGASRLRLFWRHVLPNSIDEELVNATAQIGGVTLIMAGLSFIGVGAQPPSAEWGAMAANAAPYITSAWPAAVLPGLLIAVSAVAFALLGDMLRIRIDPARAGRRRWAR